MDQTKKQLPTFHDKAEALYYFPLFRTWFSLVGLCKLPWNDIEPANNWEIYQGMEAAKVPEHVQDYCWLFEGVTGKPLTCEELIFESQVVHNLQRLLNLKMGYGTRKYDTIAYLAMGPVTEEEYESRKERYGQQLKETVGGNTAAKSTKEKMEALRVYREDQYQKLCDVVHERRGGDANRVPALETGTRLKIDFPDVLKLPKEHRR